MVKVINAMVNEATTIHWHGINQRKTPWMDGVSGVSQCPIQPGESFTYRCDNDKLPLLISLSSDKKHQEIKICDQRPIILSSLIKRIFHYIK